MWPAVKARSILLLSVVLLFSCTATNRWPGWASNLAGQLECGMSLEQIQAKSNRRIIEAGRPWGTHFINKGHTDLWLDLSQDRLEAIQLIRIDGWRFMSTRSSPRKNLCTHQLSFFLRITWSSALYGATLYLDDRQLEPSERDGTLLQVSSGSHEIRIEKAGYEPIIRRFELGPEDRGDQSIDLTGEKLRKRRASSEPVSQHS